MQRRLSLQLLWPFRSTTKAPVGSVRFIFSRQRSPGSALIRGFGALGEFSHCATVMGDSGYVVESVFTKGGVVATKLEEFKSRASYYEELDLFCPRPDLGLLWARLSIGAEYDLKGAFAVAFRERDWQDERAWYCSEHCARVALAAGLVLVNPRMQGIHPSSLYNLMKASNDAWIKGRQ